MHRPGYIRAFALPIPEVLDRVRCLPWSNLTSRSTHSVINRLDARFRGAAVALPVIDSGWFEQSSSVRSIALLVGLAGIAILALFLSYGGIWLGSFDSDRWNVNRNIYRWSGYGLSAFGLFLFAWNILNGLLW